MEAQMIIKVELTVNIDTEQCIDETSLIERVENKMKETGASKQDALAAVLKKDAEDQSQPEFHLVNYQEPTYIGQYQQPIRIDNVDVEVTDVNT